MNSKLNKNFNDLIIKMKLTSPSSNGLKNSGSQTNLFKSKSKRKGLTNTINSSHSLSNKKS